MEIFARYNICTIIYGRKHADIITLHIEKKHVLCIRTMCHNVTNLSPLIM